MLATLDQPQEVRQDSRHDARQRLLDAAMEAFREQGYRASIDLIAARAHVARQTVYNHFGSKDGLFAEVVRQASQSILVALDTEGDLRETLIAFGQAFREKLLNPDGIAMFRTMVAEAPNFPELSRQFFQVGPVSTRKRLANYLEQAMKSGLLRKEDPDIAAEMLANMLVDYERLKALLTLTPTSINPQKTAQVVDYFLRLFATEKEIS